MLGKETLQTHTLYDGRSVLRRRLRTHCLCRWKSRRLPHCINGACQSRANAYKRCRSSNRRTQFIHKKREAVKLHVNVPQTIAKPRADDKPATHPKKDNKNYQLYIVEPHIEIAVAECL